MKDYFGEIESDILGQVYERLLEGIDRRLLGQYYTPRDMIRSIWDLIDFERVAG
jgi:type I restriction-modification system DNA methylase subunit